jgi:hypothetical protein
MCLRFFVRIFNSWVFHYHVLSEWVIWKNLYMCWSWQFWLCIFRRFLSFGFEKLFFFSLLLPICAEKNHWLFSKYRNTEILSSF